MAEPIVAGWFVTPILKTVVTRLIDFLRDDVLSTFNIKKELEDMRGTMQFIMSFIKIAEKQSFDNAVILLQMIHLRDIAYDIDDIIDDCKVKAYDPTSTSSKGTCGTHLTSFSCLKNLKFSRKIAKRVKKINVKLEKFTKMNELLRGSAPSVEPQLKLNNANGNTRDTTESVVDDMVGCVQEDAEKLMKQLLDKNESSGRICINLAILGMGGIGKTTLAQKIFDEAKKSGKFQHKMWICVPKDSKVNDLLKELIRCVGGIYGQCESRNELTGILKNALESQKIFLVLDDVWNADIWEKVLKDPLNSAANGSKILITTRDVDIAEGMFAAHKHEVKPLNIEEGWLLLRNSVFETKNERNNSEYLKDVGFKIVKKCSQLPLAIKVVAGILARKEKWIGEWENIVSNDVWTQNIFINDVMKALYLSYKDLPYQLKQCFVYCSLFPEDYTFEKTDIVRMWIAEGFLGDMTSLKFGEDLHKELVNRNLLQEEGFVNCHKMHGLLRSLGQIISNDEHFYGNLKDLDKSVRRLSLQDENSFVDDSPQRLHKKLRALMLFKSSELKEIPKSVFQKLQYLRVLSLSYTGIQAIPNSIKNLLHLRYLDLSNNDITRIPESIGSLKNLQFLHLNNCYLLKKLPQSVIKLQNLMSLEHHKSMVAQMPKGMGRLKQLQSLVFTMAENENEAKQGCSMKELQSLNLLFYICISNLQKYLSLEEAKSVELSKKIHLQELTLQWKQIEDVSPEDIINVTEVFEELRPPSSLLYLFIDNFCGHSLPNWMSNSSGNSLDNLVRLDIEGCEYCQQLPALGKLPQLETLKICEASCIQIIGPEFLRGKDKSTGTNFRPFAKLKQLRLEDFSELEEWHWDEANNDKNGSTTPFPCLQELVIVKCPKLKSLPEGLRHATSLVQLVLHGNKELERISEIPTIKDLFITNCSSVQHVGNLNSLEYVDLVDAKLSVIPSWLSSLVTSKSKALSSMSSIQKLCIETGELQLCRRLCPWDIGLDWPLIKDIPFVQAHLIGQDCQDHAIRGDVNAPNPTYYVRYIKSPFSVAADLPNMGFIRHTSPTIISMFYKMKFATTGQEEVLDVTPTTTNQIWNIKRVKKVFGKGLGQYSKLPLGFHAHLKISTTDERTRVACIHQSYSDEPAFMRFHPLSHSHLSYTTNQGEIGMACLHPIPKFIHPKGPGSHASSSTS